MPYHLSLLCLDHVYSSWRLLIKSQVNLRTLYQMKHRREAIWKWRNASATSFNSIRTWNSWVTIIFKKIITWAIQLKFVCFAINSHRFVEQFNQIYEFIVFLSITWCLITICCDFLMLQSELVESEWVCDYHPLQWKFTRFFFLVFFVCLQSNIMDPNAKLFDAISSIQTIAVMSWSFFLVTFFCGMGEMVTNRFNQLHEDLCKSNWISYSLEMQQLYLIFIGNTQRPAIIAGYGNILCTRETLKKVKNEYHLSTLHEFTRKLTTLFSDGKCRILVFHVGAPNEIKIE